MPVSTWSSHDERQYRAIVKNCRRDLKSCKRIAAATVNKRRARGRSKRESGLSGSHTEHLTELVRLVADFENSQGHVRSCTSANLNARTLDRAFQEWLNLRSTMPEEQWLNIGRVIDRLGHTTEHQLSEHCREKDCKNLRWMGEGMNGFERAEMLNTRGFKDGRKSWIDVMPKGGPRMRVTHEILEGLEGLGSSLALMWAAAGAAALLVLSNAQKAGALSRPSDNAPDPAAMIIRADLNRARAAQGLPPLPG